jgi:hypothetical protein
VALLGGGERCRVVDCDDHEPGPAEMGQDGDVAAGVLAEEVLGRGAGKAPSAPVVAGHRALDRSAVVGRGGDRREAKIVQSQGVLEGWAGAGHVGSVPCSRGMVDVALKS